MTCCGPSPGNAWPGPSRRACGRNPWPGWPTSTSARPGWQRPSSIPARRTSLHAAGPLLMRGRRPVPGAGSWPNEPASCVWSSRRTPPGCRPGPGSSPSCCPSCSTGGPTGAPGRTPTSSRWTPSARPRTRMPRPGSCAAWAPCTGSSAATTKPSPCSRGPRRSSRTTPTSAGGRPSCGTSAIPTGTKGAWPRLSRRSRRGWPCSVRLAMPGPRPVR